MLSFLQKGVPVSMFIRGIEIKIKGKLEELEQEPDIYIPPGEWWEKEREHLRKGEELYIKISNTSYPGSIAIAFNTDNQTCERGACIELGEGQAFGFLADLQTLRELHAALGSAIVAAECDWKRSDL